MVKQVILTDIKDYDKDKDGNLYKTKDGRNYIRRMIKVQGSDKVLSGFKSKNNEVWKVGDEVSINIEKVEKDGKTYWNFSDVKMEDRMMDMISDLQRRVSKLESIKSDYPNKDESTTPDFTPQDNVDDDQIPF